MSVSDIQHVILRSIPDCLRIILKMHVKIIVVCINLFVASHYPFIRVFSCIFRSLVYLFVFLVGSPRTLTQFTSLVAKYDTREIPNPNSDIKYNLSVMLLQQTFARTQINQSRHLAQASSHNHGQCLDEYNILDFFLAAKYSINHSDGASKMLLLFHGENDTISAIRVCSSSYF